jgi:Domain of unknown function (DUF4365)
MTENDIKEAMSLRCIEALANSLGFTTEAGPQKDYGRDITINEIRKRKKLNTEEYTYYETNRSLKVQLKATTQRKIGNVNGNLSYPLRVKNYNDMVAQLENHKATYLFLIVLPDDKMQWLSYSEDDLILRSRCYWYQHPLGTNAVDREDFSTKTIYIPEQQMIQMDTFALLLENSYV